MGCTRTETARDAPMACSSGCAPGAAADPREVMRRVINAHDAHALRVQSLFSETPNVPLPDDERLQLQRSAIAQVCSDGTLYEAVVAPLCVPVI